MKKLAAIAPLALIICLADQATKWWVISSLPRSGAVEVTPFFNLVHWQNPGAAFGMMASGGLGRLAPLLTLLGLAVLIIVALKFNGPGRLPGIGLALAVGGALGNLIDRLRLGGVTDFLDFHWAGYHWPAFNLADAALSIGFCLLAWHWLRRA